MIDRGRPSVDTGDGRKSSMTGKGQGISQIPGAAGTKRKGTTAAGAGSKLVKKW